MQGKSTVALLKQKINGNLALLIVVVIVAALLNTLLERLNMALSLPFFLDSICTAVSAALFGVIPGVATGVLTNIFMEIGYGFENLHWQWGLCNAATGFIVGMAVRKNYFSTFPQFITIDGSVTLANSLIGAFIAVFVFGGITGSPVDFIVVGLAAAGRDIFSSAFLARIISNLIDKSIAVGVAFLIYQWVSGEESEESTV